MLLLWHCDKKQAEAVIPLWRTFDLFGELDPVGVCERAWLLVNVVNVQNLTHELNDWLGFVESCGWHWNNKMS